MFKYQLIEIMATEAGITPEQAELALQSFANTISNEIKQGGKVQIVGLGTFKKCNQNITDLKMPEFVASKNFIKSINGVEFNNIDYYTELERRINTPIKSEDNNEI